MTPIRIFAAGSTRAALTDFLSGWHEDTAPAFGPAGLLRERIEGGDRPHLFLSADMRHPAMLGADVRRFARNRTVAVARRDLGMTTENFLATLLRADVRIGTSTPGADPGGDYAEALFARADAVRPGAIAAIRARVRALVGGRGASLVPDGEPPARWFLRAGTVDVFTYYASNARLIADEFDVVTPPPELMVEAEYGLIVLDPKAQSLAEALLAPPGQAVLARHGFLPA